MRRLLSVAYFTTLALTGCKEDVAPVATDPAVRLDAPAKRDVVDLRINFDDPPEGGIQFLSPAFEVPPYTEVLICYYGTYEGPTVGVDFMKPMQSLYSHHNQVKAVYDDLVPDGTMAVCPDDPGAGENSMVDYPQAPYPPLFEYADAVPGGDPWNWLDLPEGVAVKLESGQRYVLDMHYVNVTEDTILVQNAINIGTVPLDEVEHFAAAYQLDSGPPSIEPGMSGVAEFDCVLDREIHLLSLLGHMHDFGTRYTVEWVKASGAVETIYDIEWDPHYRDNSVVYNWDLGELVIPEGDALRTRCEWFNPTDEVLGFPTEMCTTVGQAMPYDNPQFCLDGEWVIQ